MLRPILILAVLLAIFAQGRAEQAIPIQPGVLGKDVADQSAYLEDPEGDHDIGSILHNDSLHFKDISGKRKNFGFTTSTYWVRFEVINRMGTEQRFLLEASRAVTNEVQLFRVKAGKVLDSAITGDHTPFHKRPYPHRRTVFPVQLAEGEHARFYIRMKEHGEALIFPLKLWTPRSFQAFERGERMALGLFYGFLLFVVLIFSFFYFTLRERSFIYYTLYVLSFAFLQFALDGLAYRYFFPANEWLADRAVVSTSFITVLLVTFYARTYLRIWERSGGLDRVYQGIIAIGVIGFLVSLSSGSLHVLCYPFVNALSFIGTLFILASILYLKRRGFGVSNWFMMAYVILICGVITFLVGNMGMVEPNFLTVNGLKLGALGEVIFLSFTMVEKYRELQKEKEKERQNSLERLQELNKVKDEYNKELERTVEERTAELKEEREKLADTNQQIMSSIRYAQRIQNAILPPDPAIEPFFRDHFILYRPRDIVSGDIYWFASVTTTKEEGEVSVSREISRDLVPDRAELTVFASMDCTGHGVPGAFLSILGHNTLNRTLKEPTVNSPGEALGFLDRAVRTTFAQAEDIDEKVEDGMDMAMCAVDHERMILQFAGAQQPCYIVREGKVHELKGDKKAIGGSDPSEVKSFTDQHFDLQSGDCIYLFSDGYPDQFGGERGKKFKHKAFKELLSTVHDKDMNEQRKILEERFDEWKGDHEQVDDVMVIGIRV